MKKSEQYREALLRPGVEFQAVAMQKGSSKLNPNAPEFRPSALPLPLPRFTPPRPPHPPRSQRPAVQHRPWRRISRNSDRRGVDYGGGLMMRRRRSPQPLCLWRVRSPPLPVIHAGHETSIMLRNIPNQFTRRRLIQFLDDFCLRVNNINNNTNGDADACAGGDKEEEEEEEEGAEEEEATVAFDFVYLPIDFRTKMNKGYAFVNFTNPKGVQILKEENLKDQTWGYADSIRKLREIALAKIQGKKALIKHFEQSRFMCESDDYLPVCFSPPRDGSSATTSQRNIGCRYHQT